MHLGVDGGNTKTVALVAAEDGTILGAGRGGASDIYAAVSESAALASVAGAVSAALGAAGASLAEIESAAFGMAGADWPEDFRLLHDAFAARGFTDDPLVVNDAVGALRAASPDGFGVALVAGTGMAIAARSPEGSIWHSSHWPMPGGGSGLGEAALQAIFNAHLEVGPHTSLTARALDLLGMANPEAVLYELTARGKRRWVLPDYARLAPLVLDEACAGDPVAEGIVAEVGRTLARHAAAAADRVGLDMECFTLALAGGTFRHRGTCYLSAIVGALAEELPCITPIVSDLEPAAGPLMLAMERAGLEITPERRAKIAATMPPQSLFTT
ncbi:MAG: BadF/BadG/BcrA/BcrD ATPase family protein [Thermomicrobiales bacterium]